MTDLLEHVDQSIRARDLMPRGQRVLVAVSGGVDSIVLFYLLRRLAAIHRWKLIVAHFNHQLRSRASGADERFVRALARRWRIPCVVGRADVRACAVESGSSLEMAARHCRHSFLARSARRLGISTVALAHHADDQVELFFIRLLRGAGAEGLGGMKWRSPSPADARLALVRPLLDVGRDAVEAYASNNRIRWREDATNAACDILRNRIRHELVPLLRRRFQPALSKTVLRAMDLLGAEAAVVTASARTWLTKKPRRFADCPLALQRRIIQLQLQRAGIESNYELVESLRTQPGRRIAVAAGVAIKRDDSGRLHRVTITAHAFNPRRHALELKGRAGEDHFDDLHIRWRVSRVRGSSRPIRQPQWEYFDSDRVGTRIALRYWQPGDRFQPIGLGAALKLQDWFTNRKVPRAERHRLVVAANAHGDIFWVEGQRIGDKFKLTSRTKRQLIWRWNRRPRRLAREPVASGISGKNGPTGKSSK